MDEFRRICVHLEEMTLLLERQLQVQNQQLHYWQTELGEQPTTAHSCRVMPSKQLEQFHKPFAGFSEQAEYFPSDDRPHPHAVPQTVSSHSLSEVRPISEKLTGKSTPRSEGWSLAGRLNSDLSGASQWLEVLKPQTRCSRTLSAKAPEFLDGIPWHVRMMLVMACTFPSECCNKRLRLVYRIFKWMMGLSFFNEVFRTGLRAYLSYQCLGEDIGENMYTWALSFYMFAVLPLQCAMSRQFGSVGEMPEFMGQMSLQGFDWASLHRGILLFNILGLLFTMVTKTVAILMMISGSLIHQQCKDTAPVISKLLLVTELPSFLSFGPVVMAVNATIFHVFMFSKLHAYDLLCYSGALAKTFEANAENPLPLLQEVESLIGDRFRLASETWVAATVRTIVIMGLICIFIMLQFLEGAFSGIIAAWQFFILLIFLIVMALLGVPMARVSEVFEYDVLRALNTPLVVKHAQMHFGQQLLQHLHHLDWGFRVGGTVINMRLAMTVALTVLATTVATVGRAAANSLT